MVKLASCACGVFRELRPRISQKENCSLIKQELAFIGDPY